MGLPRATAFFCMSVDLRDTDNLVIDRAQRRVQVVELLQRFGVPSTWGVTDPTPLSSLPIDWEASAWLATSPTRGELVNYLRTFRSSLAHGRQTMTTITAEAYQVAAHWDVLVRNGCSVARCRQLSSTGKTQPEPIRGGLWSVPMTCTFVGGGKRTIRSQFGICQRHLRTIVQRGGFFHLNVDLTNERESWTEEMEALETLLSDVQRWSSQGRLRCGHLSQIPAIMGTNQDAKPLQSILHRAA